MNKEKEERTTGDDRLMTQTELDVLIAKTEGWKPAKSKEDIASAAKEEEEIAVEFRDEGTTESGELEETEKERAERQEEEGPTQLRTLAGLVSLPSGCRKVSKGTRWNSSLEEKTA